MNGPNIQPGIFSAFQMQHVGTMVTGLSGVFPFFHNQPGPQLQPQQPPRIPLPTPAPRGR